MKIFTTRNAARGSSINYRIIYEPWLKTHYRQISVGTAHRRRNRPREIQLTRTQRFMLDFFLEDSSLSNLMSEIGTSQYVRHIIGAHRTHLPHKCKQGEHPKCDRREAYYIILLWQTVEYGFCRNCTDTIMRAESNELKCTRDTSGAHGIEVD